MLIGVPCINRPDMLATFLRSIDETAHVLVIDNSPDGSVSRFIDGWSGVTVLRFPHNLGVAASWNLVVKWAPLEPYWVIANADAKLAPGDLSDLRAEMELGGPRWVGMNGDWRVFGITADAIRLAGLFDENYHPVYAEDCDYERRCGLSGVEAYTIGTGTTHSGSAAIRSDPAYAERNARTHPSNLAYHAAKWGGGIRGGERFATPFDRGGSARDWTLDIDRLRTNTWSR